MAIILSRLPGKNSGKAPSIRILKAVHGPFHRALIAIQGLILSKKVAGLFAITAVFLISFCQRSAAFYTDLSPSQADFLAAGMTKASVFFLIV